MQMKMKMNNTSTLWHILERIETDLADMASASVREFMVIGKDGDGVMVATEDGQGYWFGRMRFENGISKTTNEPTLLNVPGLVSMAHCNTHILMLNKRGEIYSMGMNQHGQLGLGTEHTKTHFSPKLIPISHKFISVRCGCRHSLALTEDGKVWAWGSNCSGQLGMASSSVNLSSPTQIVELDRHQIVAVECGGCHSLALTDQGDVYAWGENDMGQLGDESGTYQLTPIRILTPSPVKSIAAGHSHTLLLTRTGQVYACGRNNCGQLGISTDTETSPRLSRVLGLPSISQIASHPAFYLSIAMTSYHRCFVWGKLGDGTIISTPKKLPPAISSVGCSFSLHGSTPHSFSIPDTSSIRLSTRMSRMFDNRETSDVQFVVEERTIHAHRIILSNSSDYFARLFSERWLVPVDPEDPIVKVITIPDYSYTAFHAFLRFIYTDFLEVNPDLLSELFELATQYLVPELQQLCLSSMRDTLTPATCCLYYPLTHRHSLPELEDFQEDLVRFASPRMSEITPTTAYQSMEPVLRDNLTNAANNFPGT